MHATQGRRNFNDDIHIFRVETWSTYDCMYTQL